MLSPRGGVGSVEANGCLFAIGGEGNYADPRGLSPQNDAERQRWLRESNVLGNTVELLQVARAAGLPVFYIQNTRRPDFADQKEVLTDASIAGGGARGGPVVGTRPWEIMDEIKPKPDD